MAWAKVAEVNRIRGDLDALNATNIAHIRIAAGDKTVKSIRQFMIFMTKTTPEKSMTEKEWNSSLSGIATAYRSPRR